jgi:amino acid adenylation domain-containing protein
MNDLMRQENLQEGEFVLTSSQREMWFDQISSPEGMVHNIGGYLSIKGEVNVGLFCRAFAAVMARHDALNVVLVSESIAAGAPTQKFALDEPKGLPVLDFSDRVDATTDALSWMDSDLRRPFGVGERFYSASLLKVSKSYFYFFLKCHHLIADGWSISLIVSELSSSYNKLLDDKNPFIDCAPSYSNFVRDDQDYLSSAQYANDRRYWIDKYQAIPDPLLATKYLNKNLVGLSYGKQHIWACSRTLYDRLRELGESLNSTVFHVLLGGLYACLRYSFARSDLVIGLPILNRVGVLQRRTVGLFVKVCPELLSFPADISFEDLIVSIRGILKKDYRHQRFPIGDLNRALGLNKQSRSQLFDVVFSYEQYSDVLSFGSADAHATMCSNGREQTPLSVHVRDVSGADYINFHFVFNEAYFEIGEILRLQRRFEGMLEQLASEPRAPVGGLEILPREEREQLLERWNDTAAPYPQEQTLHGLFEEQAERTPEAVAVVYEDRELTYGELNTQANQLARHLIGLGVGPDDRVAICVERSVEMVVGLLAILKAGGAYVPLDPAYPKERLEYMLGDSAPVAVLAQAHTRVLLGELQVPVIDLEECQWHGHATDTPVVAQLTSAHLAYVIYTSGSTGMPKGVMIEHRSIVNRLLWMQQAYGLTRSDSVLQKTPFSFDVSVWEFFWTLSNGARLVVARAEGHKDPVYLKSLIEKQCITVMHFVPSMLDAFLAQPVKHECRTLVRVFCSGEALPGNLVRRFKEQLGDTELDNLYGPTEAAVDVTAWNCKEALDNTPIGRPISNTRIYILDAYGRPVPAGVSGEIYIGGAGVGRGYLNRPELTAERFVADTFSAGADARMYRTGDLGRYLADGNIEYLGRNDDQVKIRGFRIELGEIEARLAAHEGVREAVVTAREEATGEKRLVAYYTQPLEAAELQTAHLRAHLQAVLPEYMVPGAFVRLQELPLTPNGKLDRKALPAPERHAYVSREYEAPEGEIEVAIAGIWQELLGIECVGRHDHFFELGGHSLLAVRVIARMRQAGLLAEVSALFGQPTLAALAAAVGGGTELVVPRNEIPEGCERITPQMLPLVRLSQAAIDGVVANIPGGARNVQDIYPLAPLQEGILYHHLSTAQGDPYLLKALFSLEDRKRLEDFAGALQGVIARHDVLRTSVLWEGLEEPVQVVWREAQLEVQEVRLDGAEGDIAEQLQARFDPRQYRLDLKQAPLLRLVCAQDAGNSRWIAMVLFHHLVLDHAALEVVQQEMQAYLLGEDDQLPQPVPYRNYVAQARLGVSQDRHDVFFREMLEEIEEPTLPFGLEDVQGDGRGLEEARQIVEKSLGARLREQARQLGVSAASLHHLAWALVVGRAAEREDVVFGTVLLGRMQGGEGTERALGLFINTLPIRVDIGADVRSGVVATHTRLMQLLDHEHASLALAQRCSGVAAPLPLFSALLNYRHGAVQDVANEALTAWQGIEGLGEEERTNYPLTLSVDDWGADFGLTVQSTDGIGAQRVCGYMHTALQGLVDALEHAPHTLLSQLEILPREEREQLLERWNDTAAPYPQEQTLHGLFEEQAERTPEAVAVVYEDRELTYGELNTQANQLARHLIGLGVRPDDRVAICVERSVEMVVGLLAILKAGGAYVPLDPAYPKERLEYMLGDSAPVAVLAQAHTRVLLGELQVPVIDLEECQWHGHATDTPVVAQLTSAHLAYVIYTSGSTGMPKGVMIEHRNVVNYLHWAFRIYQPTKAIVSSSLSFDATITSLITPLTGGGWVQLLAEGQEIEGLEATVASVGGLVKITPNHLEVLGRRVLSSKNKSLVNVFVVGGEALPAATVDLWLKLQPGVRLVNEYGPTETVVGCVVYEVSAETVHRNIPIGRPISNTRIYILDAYGRPVPAGVSGEIYIGGAGVGRGYLNRPELTAERFVADTFSAGADARMYRTGDLGRYLADGNIEYLGRNDDQVKIRGFRIELGEIEARLAAHEGVREAVVTAREEATGEKRLVAYYTQPLEAAELQTAHLRAHLQAVLPEYMVPGAFVRLQELPLTPNGKLDRKALPAPGLLSMVTNDYEAPLEGTEASLARIWGELLGVERVGRNDNFFELGGHSLLAVRLSSQVRRTFGVDLNMAELFARPILKETAQTVTQAGRTSMPDIVPVARHAALPLSFAQQRLWFLCQMEGVSSAYHMSGGVRLKGRLDEQALTATLDRIVARHESLRTTFTIEQGEPVQRVGAPDTGFALRRHDLGADADAQQTLSHLMRSEAGEDFDLEHGPLIRGCLIRLGEAEHVLLVTMHHIVSDGWSIGVLIRELGTLYKAFSEGREDPLDPLVIQYGDYAVWQREWLNGEVQQVQSRYWQESLSGAPALLELPADRARPAMQSYAGASVKVQLDEELSGQLKALGQRQGVTLFMTVLAGWAALLARLSGQSEVVIGSPVANRTRSEVEGLIGFFVNTLALRIDLSGNPSVEDLLERVKARMLGAQENQDLPFEQVVEAVKPVRSTSHSAVFQAVLAWQNTEAVSLELGDLQLEGLALGSPTSKFDLSLSLGESGEQIIGSLEYASGLFEQKTIERYRSYLVNLLREMVADASRPVGELEILPREEREQLLERWNDTAAPYPQEQTLHGLFEEQAERTPEAVAVVYEDRELTYGELNTQANQLARHLIGLGVRPDDRVAICVERSVEMVVGLLAILKAGGAYVPLDPAYPKERLEYMLGDSAPVAVLAQAHTRVLLGELQVPVIDLEECQWHGHATDTPVVAQLTSAHLAYVIYTSGSTGMPKGVMIEHRSLLNLRGSLESTVFAHCPPNASVSLNASLAFDASWQSLLGLLAGRRLIIFPQDVRVDGIALLDFLRTKKIDVLDCTPSQLEQLLSCGLLSDQAALLTLLVGGEAIHTSMWARLSSSPNIQAYNVYGPTECTVDASIALIGHTNQRPTIGRPISNTRIYILDAYGRPVPAGVSGEIYIGGAGVGRGYLNRPELTAERFVADTFSAGADARMYRTGDLGRYLADGNIEYLGRNDDQVKIRGFRIELGEIEARLAAHEGVREAVVTAREEATGEKRLVAYYTQPLEAAELQTAHLRAHLQAVLPEYMVPGAFVRLQELPLTPNGKLDRKALPAPGLLSMVTNDYEAPLEGTEASLARIWGELLGVERVGRNDNFFELGGHSLLAVRLSSQVRRTFGVDLNMAELFARPILKETAQTVTQAGRTSMPDIVPVARHAALPLSFAQQRLWFLCQMEGVSSAYHMSGGVRLKGRLDEQALTATLDRIVARHESLRTTFTIEQGEPVQRVGAPDTGFALRRHDLGADADAQQTLSHLMRSEAGEDFDLEHGPLIRGCLIRLGEAEHVLLVTMHHIVSDGWSIGVLIRELGTLYKAFSEGREDPLDPLVIQYGDYAVWQREWLNGEVQQVQSRYWQESLSGAPALLELPADRARPAMQSYAGASVKVQLDEELSGQLKALGQRQGVTLFMTVLAGWAALLARLSGQSEVVIGSPVANRTRSEVEGLIGFFVNTLALRIDLSGNPSVEDLLERVKARMLGAQENQDLPFEQVVEAVKPVRSTSHSAVFQAVLAWQNTEAVSLELGDLQLEGLALGSPTSKFDLSLSLGESGEQIIGSLEYASGLFEQKTIERYRSYLVNLLREMVADASRPVGELEILPREEREQLLERWNDTAAPYPQEQTLHGLFEEQAERTPEAVAVVYEDRELTYGELNTQANQLARHLIGLGVRPDDRVAICVERSVEMVVGLLAILKAGGAYVPLDPAYPKERLEYMLGDSAPVAVLAQAHTRVLLGELQVPVIDLEECQWHGHATDTPVVAQLTSAHLAYVIYTSGSTGMPKGVMIEHRNVTRLFSATLPYFSFSSGDIWALFHSFAFDFSVWEIWGALLHGGQLIVIPKLTAQSALEFYELLCARNVTILNQTPSAFRQLIAAQKEINKSHSLRFVIFGGEALIPSTLHPWHQRRDNVSTKLVNMYGITETTVHVTLRGLNGEKFEGTSPIGRPLKDLRIYILDAHGRPVPAGVTGEMYVGGAGVARGYLNRPELTAERFVADTFSAGADARMYRTGDLGRYLADGNIEYLGRNDDQVKIRGFRIELGEIEARLAAHEGVREAVVTAREEATGEKRLVAYYTQPLEAAELQTAHLRAHLQAVLPEYMVPGAFVRLQELPLTPNGKLDRKALPAPGLLSMVTNDYEAPLEGTEASLARIWGELLGVERVGRNDNFFELGGHSLLAVRLSSQVRRTFGVDLNMAELFARPILKETAQTVTQAGRTSMPDIVPVARHAALPLSFAQQRLWFLCQMEGVSSAYHMSGGVRLKGRLDEQALTATLDRIVARHESLRTTFTIEQGEPVQRVGAPDTGFALRRHDLGADADAQQTLSHLMRSEAGEDFDLEHGPLIRGCLIRLGEAEHVLLVTMHHIVSDGWSIGVLIRELGTLYKAFSEGREDPLDPLVIQYGDYAVWQREWLNGEVQQVQSRYWQESLSGAPALLELPADRARPAMQSYAGASVKVQLDEELSGQLKALGQRQGVTLFMTVLAGWAALLARLSGQSEVVIGSPVANRTRSEVEGLIGFFVNTLALRIDLSGNPSVEDLLERVKARMLGAQENQDLPFEQVVEAVKPVRSTSHSAVFQAVLAWQNTEAVSLELGDLQLEGLALGSPTSKFDLSLSLGESGEQIIGSLEYASGLFEQKTIERYRSYLVNLLREMVADASRPVGELEILPREEREQLLERWNDTAAPYPQEQTLHGLFEEQAERTPEAVAVVYEDRELTYGELNTQANQLARHLIGLGVRPDDRVAICVERSVEMVVGLLAILKAGGAYVPLDPAYPADRLAFMLEDSDPVAVLTLGSGRAAIEHVGRDIAVPRQDLHDDASLWASQPETNPDAGSLGLSSRHMAYVIYTSGSTGRPKGVMVEHRNLVNYLLWLKQAHYSEAGNGSPGVHSVGFDGLITTLYGPLVAGQTLTLWPTGKEIQALADAGNESHEPFTLVKITPSHLKLLNQVLPDGCASPTRALMMGGEPIIPADLLVWQQNFPEIRLINHFGPTETTVGCATFEITASLAQSNVAPPIGRPIWNTHIYILDRHGQLVPAGVTGEMYVGGAGVARGYLNRPELTAERFVADTFSAGADARMYRTGDLGRYLADGNIEYLGRNDDQVKIRGFRIELGEIEARLAAHEGVREAVVTAREEATGEKRLVAYYTQPLEAAELQTAHLRAHLQAVLPEYMVPGAFVRLQELPLTPNGKLDRKALPAPERHAYVSREYEAPEGEIEVAIAGIWQELLGIECVGRHDHFFELGGNSLLVIRLISYVRNEIGVDLKIERIFEDPILSSQAKMIEDILVESLELDELSSE